MTTAIVYASKHGTTGDIATLLAAELGEDTVVFNLVDGPVNLDDYRTVVLGTAIYAGQPVKAMGQFAKAFDWTGKEVALFVCGMEPGADKRVQELERAYPEALRAHAKAARFLTGRFRFGEMNKAERFIIARVAKTKEDVDAVDQAAIAEFAAEFRA